FFPAPAVAGGPFGLSAVAVFAVVGPGFVQMRLVAFAWALGLLALTYLIGRELYDSRTARLATLLLALSWPFWLSGRLFRLDIGLTTIGYAALALIVLGRRRAVLNALGGLILALGASIHPHVAA